MEMCLETSESQPNARISAWDNARLTHKPINLKQFLPRPLPDALYRLLVGWRPSLLDDFQSIALVLRPGAHGSSASSMCPDIIATRAQCTAPCTDVPTTLSTHLHQAQNSSLVINSALGDINRSKDATRGSWL